MKKLLSILFLSASLNLFGQGLPAKFHIPEKYNDYQNLKLSSSPIVLDDRPVFGIFYDIDGDNRPDVGEIYLMRSYDPVNHKVERSEFPLFYDFDFNGDHQLDYDEMVLDEEMDGLNGNERWLLPERNIPQKSEQDYGLGAA